MSFSYTGTTTAILYLAPSFATASVVGPGTDSAASYQRLSWPGQKYGPLKISCRHRICTPFLPASSINGMCLSSIACLIFSTGWDSSLIGLAHWISPPMSLRGISCLLVRDASLRQGPSRRDRRSRENTPAWLWPEPRRPAYEALDLTAL